MSFLEYSGGKFTKFWNKISSTLITLHPLNLQEQSFSYDSKKTEDDESEIAHDVLYREGLFQNNVTYTPRMLLVDRSAYLKYFNDDGNLYNDLNSLKLIEDNSDENIEKIESEVEKPHEFQADLAAGQVTQDKVYDFKDSIRNWPDFMYARYHWRSLNDLKKYVHNEPSHAIDTFSSGETIWDSNGFQDDYCDKIRTYIEECNRSQGFQVLFDAYDGFAGLSVKCLEHLQDEYSKPSLSFPVFAPIVENFANADEPMSDSIRLINTAYSYSKLFEYSNLFVPLSTMSKVWRKLEDPRKYNGLNFDSTNLYQTSSILASFIDTASLKFRLRNGNSSLTSFCSEQSMHNRKMCSGKIALPFPMNEKEDLIDFLDRYEGVFLENVSPGHDCGTDGVVQNVTVRGIPQNRLKRSMEKANKQLKMEAYKCNSVSEMIQFYFYCNTYASLTHASAVEQPLHLQSPFPLDVIDHSSEDGFVNNVPVMTTTESSAKLSNTLDHLHTQVSRVKIAKIPRFLDSGMDSEDYKEILESLITMKENYEDKSFI